MTNLYCEYDRFLKKEECSWCYYEDLKPSYKNKGLKHLLANPKEFIKAYFKTGCKGGALNDRLLSKLEDTGRLPHVVSTFILGIILRERLAKLKDALDRKCNKFQQIVIEECKQNNSRSMSLSDPFTFTWFLTCLGHDIGYYFECEEVIKNPSSLIDSIENVDNLLSEDQMINYLPPDENAIVPEKLKNNCVHYFKAGISDGNKFRGERCVRDHGISGGIIYYNLLRDNYESVKKNSGKHQNCDCFIENDRLWSKKILETYIAAGSWAIICHNIWLIKPKNSPKETIDVYKSRHLSELITDEPLIKVSEHPFLFLLALADTLEPIKKEHSNLKSILQETNMSFNKDGFSIKSHPKKDELDLDFLGCEKKGETYKIF